LTVFARLRALGPFTSSGFFSATVSLAFWLCARLMILIALIIDGKIDLRTASRLAGCCFDLPAFAQQIRVIKNNVAEYSGDKSMRLMNHCEQEPRVVTDSHIRYSGQKHLRFRAGNSRRSESRDQSTRRVEF